MAFSGNKNPKISILLITAIEIFFSHGTLCKIECLSANFCSRYDAITHPMNFTGSWRRAKVLVIAAWILSAAFASPMLHFYHTKETGSYAYGV